ncbi:related to C3HC4 zinc-binding integral peroxisomal membrane protein [Fusarium fujikuroi]|nr:related to C3HC4 zinc-binding integral peroxisomal membrane protein [Fusarium fujikuroi]
MLAPQLNVVPAETLATLAYFALTTIPGNRTLGEEYCDLVQIDARDGQLPAIGRRAGYVAASILLPYIAARILPGLRARLRNLLQRRLESLRKRDDSPATGREARMWSYLDQHLGSFTSGAPFKAVILALFYFSGTYYQLSKRLLSLRYVFTRTVPDTPDRAGYELLGASSSKARVDIFAATHTPAAAVPRIQLTDDKAMGYIKGGQQRKCTLCLEEMRDPSATQCGHVFCWECIGDWVREKPECPLCRREAMAQHILPLRVIN